MAAPYARLSVAERKAEARRRERRHRHQQVRIWWFAGACACTVLAAAATATAQTADVRGLSLRDALDLAGGASESVAIAELDVASANANTRDVASSRWPQIDGAVSYSRTLRSQFQSLGPDDGTPVPPECMGAFTPDPSLPVAAQLANLGARLACPSGVGGSLSNLPFGRRNQWGFGLGLSQAVDIAGQLAARVQATRELTARARVALTSSRAQATLDVATAYFDALLGDRLVTIVEATEAQVRSTLQQTVTMQRVGTRPQFDVLRARVALESIRPDLIRRRSTRDLAYARLKQLLDIPIDEAISLTTSLDTPPVELRPAQLLSPQAPPLPAADDRAPVREAIRSAESQRYGVTAASRLRWPTLAFSAQFQQVAYPESVAPLSNFFSNWSVGFNLGVPIATGGRIGALQAAAQAAYQQAQLRLSQVRELTALDTTAARLDFAGAQAAYEASAGTVDQAVEAHRIAEIRFREGLSTQVELSDAQLLLEQAQGNRAVALRDLRLARLRMALLGDLPLGSGAPFAGGTVQSQPAMPATPATANGPSAMAASQRTGTGASALPPFAPVPASPTTGGVR